MIYRMLTAVVIPREAAPGPAGVDRLDAGAEKLGEVGAEVDAETATPAWNAGRRIPTSGSA